MSMDMPQTVVLSRQHETPVSSFEVGKFRFRSAYARSTDSRSNGDAGQDYLTFRTDGLRFAFVLCDGVSQSFYGELAASVLGESLLNWFWALETARLSDRGPEAEHIVTEPGRKFQLDLCQQLESISKRATRLVSEHVIPGDVPPFVRVVLEKKRVLGSESTFVAGLVDLVSGNAFFAWMGDSRLRLWKGEHELLTPFDGSFITTERWSSLKGPVGTPHLAVVNLALFDQLAVYSDGFSPLDGAYQPGIDQPISNQMLNELRNSASELPSSDDISFLDLWLDFPVLPDSPGVKLPNRSAISAPRASVKEPTTRPINRVGFRSELLPPKTSTDAPNSVPKPPVSQAPIKRDNDKGEKPESPKRSGLLRWLPKKKD